MNRLALLALLLGGCQQDEGDMFPINPGGGGGAGGSTRVDAAVDSGGDGGGAITARVCLLLSNVHTLGGCAASGAGNLTVTLGSSSATTADNGTFSIERPASTTGLVWRITGDNIVATAMRFSAVTSLPAIDAAAYADMIAAMNPNLDNGDGAIIMRVARAGVAVANATVVAVPAPQQIYYDGATELAWETDATGTYGVTWMPSVPLGEADLTVTANAMTTPVMDIPVFADTLTFAFAEIL